MRFGEYPIEYNPKIHGVYDPARYYGKPDIPFGQLKLGEVGSWIGRRNKSPQAFAQLISRAWWRYQHKYIFPKRGGVAPVFQILFGGMALFYCLNYKRIKHHKNYKYH